MVNAIPPPLPHCKEPNRSITLVITLMVPAPVHVNAFITIIEPPFQECRDYRPQLLLLSPQPYLLHTRSGQVIKHLKRAYRAYPGPTTSSEYEREQLPTST